MIRLKPINFALVLCSALLVAPMTIAAPAKASSVEQLLQLSEVDVVIQSTLAELQPHFEAESESIILRMTGGDQLDAHQLIASQEIAQLL